MRLKTGTQALRVSSVFHNRVRLAGTQSLARCFVAKELRTGEAMRSYAFLITAAVMITAFIGIVLASVTLTSTKDARPLQQASLVVK
jgi:hypothetical protein